MDLEGSDSMEISYIKDGNRNTMIIKDIKIEKNDYKLQMVLNNHIEGLVQISVESINNETMLYYDISSKTQMSNMFTRKQMSGKELYIFIKDIKMLSERMSEYLLTLDNIIFDTDLIFFNRQKGKYEFCYVSENKEADSRYATLDAQYAKEQSELNSEIASLEKAVDGYEKHEKDVDHFIALIDKYENFDKLTIAMLNEFIEKILVHERDRKGSTQTTQEVEIYFNFVGRFVPPAFGEVELTPEELEEIRKREERKDRLHQNYLKRKASGAQKQYENKIKDKRKAEIEAKKAAIRAEDIAKGVFVPVSQLPAKEPKKGVQTA